MDIEKIRKHVEAARENLANMGGGTRKEEMKLFKRFAQHAEAAKAELNRANIRSKEQVFIREAIVEQIEGLEREAMGDDE